MDTERKRFIIIDDDPGNNLLCKILIRKTYPDALADIFTDPKEALAFIQTNLTPDWQYYVLLDIHMPLMNGWEFMDHFALLNARSNIKVFIVSSSLYQRDREQALNLAGIQSFVEKPLNEAILRSIAG